MNFLAILGIPTSSIALAAKRRARLQLAERFTNQLENAVELLARGQIDEDEAIEMIHQYSAISFKEQSRNRQQERTQKILLLTLIDSIDVNLAKVLISEYGSLEAISQAEPGELQRIGKISNRKARTILKELKKLAAS